MKRNILLVSLVVLIALLIVGGYKIFNGKKEPLNPSRPITITVWHYYNGNTKDKFDALINKFNETIGVERGIVVEAKSHGDVNQLANAVYDAANKTIGSQVMPDIFAAYPDNAYRTNKLCGLVELEQYFSQDELKEFRKEFLEEGRFGADQKLRILPIAKSTEILYLNKTYWDKFSEETGANLDDLNNWEGVVRTSEKYKNYSGRAFLSIDGNANYMLSASMQLGTEFYTYSGDRAKLNFSKDIAHKIWENYYIPYLKGYFIKSGRFSSDDAKTGTVLAYTGSTAGAAYFPKQVAFSEKEVYPIDIITLPYPHFENGKPYAIQQGAGMCITKSDKAHEYASALFLKWFTEPEQNIDFAVSTSYFPVKNESLVKNKILPLVDKTEVSNEAIKKSINTTLDMLDTHILYGNRPFDGSYDMRALLENNLFNFVQKDLEKLEARVATGEERSKVIESLISEENFNRWYQQFSQEVEKIMSK
ncbi:extracellular solute-binding protein [Clostridium chromiireducens]|uniref:Extracellular solute-binding protein n=1 Tax=Clostridium chromiireducens TaxID=225345 RepID=A0A399IXH5_9CLOT|nr:extracellular solute-binding protein [Clostridium chromiireducens]RII36282.1 extracellular solute-binding protein [Clostridium chromiireducens]